MAPVLSYMYALVLQLSPPEEKTATKTRTHSPASQAVKEPNRVTCACLLTSVRLFFNNRVFRGVLYTSDLNQDASVHIRSFPNPHIDAKYTHTRKTHNQTPTEL